MTRQEAADELLRDCPDDTRKAHEALAKMLTSGASLQDILTSKYCDELPETYAWLKGALSPSGFAASWDGNFALNKAGRDFLADELDKVLKVGRVRQIFECNPSVWNDAVNSKIDCVPGQTDWCFELAGKYTKTGNPYIITFHVRDHFERFES